MGSHVFLARAARAVRRLWPDRNPLKRTADRLEAAVGAGLTVAFLAGAPLAAIAAGNFASSAGSRTTRAQQAAQHQVPAVLLGPILHARPDQDQVPARWVASDRRGYSGHIPVPLGTGLVPR
jgi:hypothetical protein